MLPFLFVPFLLPSASLDSSQPVKIVRIIDGDTFELAAPLHGSKKVRLLGIDTPETRRAACRKERDLGFEAKGYANHMARGKSATLILTPAKKKTDRYGRLLGRVSIAGVDYGQHMISAGYAVRWTREWRATPRAQRWCG